LKQTEHVVDLWLPKEYRLLHVQSLLVDGIFFAGCSKDTVGQVEDKRVCRIFLDARVHQAPLQLSAEDVTGPDSRGEIGLLGEPLTPMALLTLGRNPQARRTPKHNAFGQAGIVAVQQRGVVTRQKVNLQEHAHHLSVWADAA